ncbi:MAG TPA: hypothetical protein VF395_19540 [Polyangiaceae bacterium]
MTFSTPFTPLGGLLLAGLFALSITACDNGASDANGGADAHTQPSGSGGDGSMTTGTGGGTGSAGAAGAAMDISMIDDMEDKDGSILAAEGRVGAWYTYNDTTGTQVPPAGQMGFDMTALNPPRGTSTYGATTSGSGFTTWGAGIGFDLNNDGTAKQPYDASAYKGVTFWAKAGAGGIKNIRLNVQDAQTAPEGGICDKTATKGCNDHRGTAVLLTEDWKQFTFAFDAMKVVGFGQVFPTFQTNKLFAIQFQASQNVKFDIWLDDIAFYK